MLTENSFWEYKSEDLPEYNRAFDHELDEPFDKSATNIHISFYPRSMASGKCGNHYFGVLEINGKIYPISNLAELPLAIASYLNSTNIEFTPF